jgi:hypothetical protein
MLSGDSTPTRSFATSLASAIAASPQERGAAVVPPTTAPIESTAALSSSDAPVCSIASSGYDTDGWASVRE